MSLADYFQPFHSDLLLSCSSSFNLSHSSLLHSLSLEYHPRELQGMTKINPENMPKVQYLQCPAGVRIRHLEKFLCSKFSISPQDHSIDLIYEDKVLAKDLNLMDVVYCFSWKRVSPGFSISTPQYQELYFALIKTAS